MVNTASLRGLDVSAELAEDGTREFCSWVGPFCVLFVFTWLTTGRTEYSGLGLVRRSSSNHVKRRYRTTISTSTFGREWMYPDAVRRPARVERSKGEQSGTPWIRIVACTFLSPLRTQLFRLPYADADEGLYHPSDEDGQEADACMMMHHSVQAKRLLLLLGDDLASASSFLRSLHRTLRPMLYSPTSSTHAMRRISEVNVILIAHSPPHRLKTSPNL